MGRGASSRCSPRNQSELSDSWSASHDGGGGAPVPFGQAASVETTAEPALETVDRASELKKESRRSRSAWQRRRSPQCSGASRVEGEEKDQRQRKKQRQHWKEVRPPRASNDKGHRRGWLGDLADGIFPDDGLYTGRSKTVLGGQQGLGNPWKANGSLHSHQKVVKTYGNMISSP